jgi:hypothetical protein
VYKVRYARQGGAHTILRQNAPEGGEQRGQRARARPVSGAERGQHGHAGIDPGRRYTAEQEGQLPHGPVVCTRVAGSIKHPYCVWRACPSAGHPYPLRPARPGPQT